MKTAEASRAGVSASTTSASNTTRTTFQRAAEAFVQTKTDLEQTHSRQHEVAQVEVTADITRSADQTDIQQVDCTVQVVVSIGRPRRLPIRRTILYASTKSSTGQTRTALLSHVAR